MSSRAAVAGPSPGEPSIARELRDVAFVEFANGLAFSAFVPFLALWLTGPVGLSPLDAGIVGFGVYSLTAIAGGLIGGRMSDRFGRRRTMVLGLGAGTARLGVLAVTTDPVVVAALIAVGGFVDSVVPPASSALVADRVPVSRLNEGFGTVRAARTLALGVGPVLGAALVPISFAAVLAAAAVCRGTALVAALMVAEPPRRPLTAPPVTRSVLRDGPFLRILAATAVLALFYGWYDTVVPVHLEAQGIGVTTWGAIYAGGALFTASLAVRVARLIDRFGHLRRWVAAGAVAFALGFALLLPGSLATVVPGVAFVALAQMILNPLESSITAMLAPATRTGTYQGALNVVYSIAFATGPVFGLALYDGTSAGTTFLVAVLVLPVGALLVSAALGSASASGRLALTPAAQAAMVGAVAAELEVLSDEKDVHHSRIRQSRERIRALRLDQAKVARERRARFWGLGTVPIVAGTLVVVTALAIQFQLDTDGRLVTGEFAAILAAATLLAAVGAALQWNVERMRQSAADAHLMRLEQAEKEEMQRLRDAEDGLIEWLVNRKP